MASNTNDLFNSHEMEKRGGQFVNLTFGVQDVLGMMWGTLTLLKTLTNFTLKEFDKLASHVVPTIKPHARSPCEFFFHILFFQFWFFKFRLKVLGLNFSVYI